MRKSRRSVRPPLIGRENRARGGLARRALPARRTEHLKQAGRKQFRPTEKAPPPHAPPAPPDPVMAEVPLTSARPSLHCSTTGSKPVLSAERRSPSADRSPQRACPRPTSNLRHVRQRHQIAAGPDRTLGGNFRQDAAVQQGASSKSTTSARDAGITARQRVRAGRHDRPRLGSVNSGPWPTLRCARRLSWCCAWSLARHAVPLSGPKPGLIP